MTKPKNPVRQAANNAHRALAGLALINQRHLGEAEDALTAGETAYDAAAQALARLDDDDPKRPAAAAALQQEALRVGMLREAVAGFRRNLLELNAQALVRLHDNQRRGSVEKAIIGADFLDDPDTWAFHGVDPAELEGIPTALAKSWSSELMEKFPGSRWITYRHNRILIRGNKDGTAQVVFSANPAMEHLRILPKTSGEYERISRQIDDQKEKRAKQGPVKELTAEEKAAARQADKSKQDLRKQAKTEYVSRVKEILGVERLPKPLEKLEAEARRITEKPTSTGTEELQQLLDAKPELHEKATKALGELAERDVVADQLTASLGAGTDVSEQRPIKTGDEALDRALKRVKLSSEDKLAILREQDLLKQRQKEIAEQFDDAKPGGRREAINNLLGIGISDWNAAPKADSELIEQALQREENRQRAARNFEFYNVLDAREAAGITQKMMADGARASINAVAGLTSNGSAFSKEILDLIGTQGAAIVLGNQLMSRGEGEAKDALADLEKVFAKRADEVVQATLQNAGERSASIEALKNLAKDGTLAQASASANMATQYKELGRDVGLAAGSLEAAATIIDALRDPNFISGDLTFDGGKDLGRLEIRLEAAGLDSKKDCKITLDDDTGRYAVTVMRDHFDRLLPPRSASENKRNEETARIKAGGENEKGWVPAGSPKVVYDVKTPAEIKEMGEKRQGYEKYENTPGEPGYSSKFPTGETLYRKGQPNEFKDSQQEMIKFALAKKRAVWNAGAGLGKTAAFLGIVSELKERGELEGSFGVMCPPSRLREEFFKDRDKFFPHLKVLELDKISGLEKKKQALERAKAGEYDIVLTGHDSIKGGTSKADVDEYVACQMAAWRAAEGEKGRQNIWGKEVKAKEAEFRNQAGKDVGVPALLASYKPAFVGVDEAHEAFQFKTGQQAGSQRFNAIKMMAASSRYFVPATGTTIRNHVGELGAIIHATDPTAIPNVAAFANKYGSLGQGTTVFQGEAINDFRRQFDDVMISRETKIAPKLVEGRQSVALSPQQRADYARNELQYRLDRDAKNRYGVIDTRTGRLVFASEAPGQERLHTINAESVGFTPGEIATPKERSFLKEQGFDGSHYRLKKLGQGANARRDALHERTLNAGDWKQNAKVGRVLDQMRASGDANHAVFYENKASLDTLRSAMTEGMGLRPDQVVHIDGSMSAKDRDRMVKQYQTNPEVKVILLSSAGATGLNLQKIDHVHHLTRPDTYAEQVQRNARGYRTGRQGDVAATYYDSDTPYDNRRVATIRRKQATTSAVGEWVENPNLKQYAEQVAGDGVTKGFAFEAIPALALHPAAVQAAYWRAFDDALASEQRQQAAEFRPVGWPSDDELAKALHPQARRRPLLVTADGFVVGPLDQWAAQVDLHETAATITHHCTLAQLLT
jgi:Helicase conserved C-terminal domain